MSIFAMIFTREMTAPWTHFGRSIDLRMRPSTRLRIWSAVFVGSTWMSEAPWSTASATIRFTIRMTGAASLFFRRSSRSFPSRSWASCTTSTSRSSTMSLTMVLSEEPRW
ncbi:MAG: hypothetical protein HZB86_11175 [Deltaproteobacteria bacterium]|nr:hypothetical protein [Deltaproteobacteria bacterium]